MSNPSITDRSGLRIVLINDVRPAIVDHIPFCNERCSHHDGKRCGVLGRRPGNICEPAIAQAGISWDLPVTAEAKR